MSKPSKLPNIYSPESEQAVLGSLLLRNDCFDEVQEIIQASDFYVVHHQMIYKAISALLNRGQSVDLLILEQQLKEAQCLAEVGGLAYLAELSKNTPSAANVTAYAEIVAEHSRRRQLTALGQYITAETKTAKDKPSLEHLIETVEKCLTDIQLQQQQQDIADLDDTFEKIIDRMEHAARKKDPVTGMPSGIVALDHATTGGQPGDFIIIAARPSMGKTAFSLNIAEATLERTILPIQYYSQEMPADQLLQRFIAMKSRVDLQRIRQATLDDEEWSRISTAMGYVLEHWKNRLLLDDESGLTVQRLRTKVRRNIRRYGKPAAIFIDYLQLMSSSGRYENRNLEIAAISAALKKLAKEIQCPVYALSQLNRSLEQRTNKRPVNADLRESGSLEQDADVILFIYRDEVYNPDSEHQGIAEIIIGKQRNGPLGKVLTRFTGEYSRFENINNELLEN